MNVTNKLIFMVIMWDIAAIALGAEIIRCLCDKYRIKRRIKWTKNKLKNVIDK